MGSVEMNLERILDLALLFGVVVAISLVIVGIPAAALKAVAGTMGAPSRKGVVSRSILWGALVGVLAIAVQMTANFSIQRVPDWRAAVAAFGGWQWTMVGFVVLTAMAVAVDYGMVLRPLRPRLSLLSTACFLLFSNIWVMEGAWLLGSFNQMTLFPSCFDPATKRIVQTFSEPRPETCEELSD